MRVKINLLKEPELRNPFLVSGLPGISYVGKVSTGYLIRELKAELFGEVYSHFFPSHVIIKKDGTVELMKNELYYWKNRELERDIIFFTGNTQAASPEGQYLIAEEVLDTAIKFGVKRLYSIAAYVVDKSIEKPEVYGAATEPKLLEEVKMHGVLPMVEGSIGGTNGLLFGLAKTKNLQGICLLGETRGYRTSSGRFVVDAKAVRAVLEILTKILSIKVDMAPIESQAELTAEFIERLEEVESRMLKQAVKSKPKDLSRYIT
jgi:uncharacterized protein (TIGR00162 family)